MEEKKILDKEMLRMFIGSEHWYCHGINRKVVFTDGAKYVADNAGAYWLLDEIAIIQPYSKKLAQEVFQIWTLVVRKDKTIPTTVKQTASSPKT